MFNSKFKLMLMTISVLILGSVSAANAQLVDGARLTVNIPNAFVIKDKSFAPGRYMIARTPNTNDARSLMVLRGDNGSSIIFDTIAARSLDAARNTQLIFDNIGGNYFLSKIWIKGDIVGSEIPKTRSQRELIARNRSEPRTVTVDSGF